MIKIRDYITTTLGIIGAVIAPFLGGWDVLLKVMVSLSVSDYIIGVTNAIVFKNSPKTESGGLNSNVGFKGIVKKLVIYLMIGLTYQMDLVLETNGFFRSATIYGFMLNELISIVETVGLMGVVNLPPSITNIIDLLKNKSKEGVENGNK